MVQTADRRYGNNSATRRRLTLPWGGCVSFERQVSPAVVVVIVMRIQNPPQALLVEHDHMVETFSSYGANQPFSIGIVPR